MPILSCLCCLGCKSKAKAQEALLDPAAESPKGESANHLKAYAVEGITRIKDLTTTQNSELFLVSFRYNGKIIQAVEKMPRYADTGNLQATMARPSPSELDTLRALQQTGGHPSINRCYGYTMEGQRVRSLLMAYANKDDLDLVFRDAAEDGTDRKRNDLAERMPTIVHEVAKGLAFLHQHGWMHGDIKLENVLVHKYWCQWQIQITDFGSSCEIPAGQDSVPFGSEPPITPGYAAPEDYRSFKFDIFSFAIFIWVMATWNQYYTFSDQQLTSALGSDNRELPKGSEVWYHPYHKMVVKGQRPMLDLVEATSPLYAYSDLMQRMWQQKPSHRPDANAVVAEARALMGACARC